MRNNDNDRKAAELDENAQAVPPESRSLHTEADEEQPLTRAEADVAGISRTPSTVYGEDSYSPNADDQRDMNAGADDDA
jgi:hypothetical protein